MALNWRRLAALRARAVGAEFAGRHAPAPGFAGLAAVDAHRRAAAVVAAGPYVERRAGRPIQFARTQNRSTRGIAVLQRHRPAQHLDAVQRRQRKRRRLALAIGGAGRNAVHDQADAADAEGRTRAESARLDLQVLREILPVERGEAGNALQGLGQVHLTLTIADPLGVQHRDRTGQGAQRTAGTDNADRVDIGRLRLCLGPQRAICNVLRLRLQGRKTTQDRQ
jgi:hypothetical protein